MDGCELRRPSERPKRSYLINAVGDFDHSALVSWANDSSIWKSYSQDAHLERIGIREGDLLVADPEADIEHGQLVLMADFEMGWCSVAMARRDEDGVLWAVWRDRAIALDGAHEMLNMRLIGFVPMRDRPFKPAGFEDLLLARIVPDLQSGAAWDVPSHWAMNEARVDEAMKRFGFTS